MNEYDYAGNKAKNYFTAYLQKCIWWKRWNYLKKKEKIDRVERPLEESLVEFGPSTDEILELRYREEVLSEEQERRYPGWNELSDQRLTEALLMLREDEKAIEQILEMFRPMLIRNALIRGVFDKFYIKSLR
jgi:hypothetical protein